jgi:hypothetical protein
MKKIKISGGFSVKVDNDKFNYLNQFTWRLDRVGGNFYVSANINKVAIRMINLIKDSKKSGVVKLIDGDPLNLQSKNLFYVKINKLLDEKVVITPSSYRGVSVAIKNVPKFSKKQKRIITHSYVIYKARFSKNGTLHNLGDFKTEKEAVEAYNEAKKTIK